MFVCVCVCVSCLCACVCVHVCVWQDQQQTLTAIDTLLQHQPITSQHLATFIDKHPDVVGQQGIKDDNDDLSQTADSEHLSDIVQSDTDTADTHVSTKCTADTTMPCDTADTTVNTERTADNTMSCDTADTTVNTKHIGESGDTDTADTSMNNDTADTRVNAEHIVSTTTSRRHLSNR